MQIQDLKDKKILILGFGREGKDTLLFLRKHFPKKKIGIADQKQDKNYLKKIKGYDVIIKSPGVPNFNIAPFLKKGQIVTSQTEIFFDECPGMIIGITGTKGKSTTASLIHAVLKKGGVRSHLIGNIGEPVLSYLKKAKPEDVFVYELSSFQLENLKQSPHIAVLLNVYPEHLDHHQSFAKYAGAKANITKYQGETDFLIYNSKDRLVSNIAKHSEAQKLPFAFNISKNSWVASTEPARIIGQLFRISTKNIEQAMRNFKPLRHRLELIGKYKGITFYNDSLATIPEATISALNTLGPKVQTLIVGGFDRGIKFEKLAHHILKSKVKTLIFFPITGLYIWEELEKIAKQKKLKKLPIDIFTHNMQEAIEEAYIYTDKGKICLLSPAASSFNMFKDYKDRGEQFKKWVKQYGKGK